MYNNKKIFILGMARSGYEAAKLLSSNKAIVTISDMKEQDINQVEELKNMGVTVYIGIDHMEIFDETYDYVVKNPGLKFEHPICLEAKKLNIPVINEVEVAYNLLDKDVKIIGITGSNGKTTTTTIIYELLKKMGLGVHLGGNIGYPVSSLVKRAKKGDVLVLEISGHQLHDTVNFKTNISVMTNLSEVHLDHFKTYDFYKKNKCLIFRHHTSDDIAILNNENNDVLDGTKDINSTKIYFSSKTKKDVYLEDDYIVYKGNKIINIKDIKLKGVHNYENIMCAIAACKQFDIKDETIFEVLNSFLGVEHRMEFILEIKERTFYNDSKSTNVESTKIALNAFSNPTILLLGGLDRNHSFLELKSFMKNTKAVVCFGETNNRIKEFCDSFNMKCYVVNTLNEAVNKAYEISCENDTILLSPACASWDQYKCFEDRGNDFKNIVNEINNKCMQK